MDASILVIPAVALAASLITRISGFGLGTLLLPVFALFFPLEVAILLTAVVHLLNNLFKLGLLWKDIHWPTVLRFGVPGILGAYFGARLMLLLGERAPLFQGVLHRMDPLDLVIAGLMLLFGLFELSKQLNSLSLPPQWVWPDVNSSPPAGTEVNFHNFAGPCHHARSCGPCCARIGTSSTWKN